MAREGKMRTIAPLFLAAAMFVGCGAGAASWDGGNLYADPPAKLINRAIKHYQETEYEQALQPCQGLAGVEHEMKDKALVRYLAYCGLSNYRLGNRDKARPMLTRAHDVYNHGDPDWLNFKVSAELDKAVADLQKK